MALGSTSTVTLLTDIDSDDAQLGGSIGYGFCKDGNDSGPCPFYLGSLTATAISNLTATMACDDRTQQRVTLEDLTFKLAQPAFGIAEGGTASKGFPVGALLFESSFEVAATPYERLGPNEEAVVALVEDAAFSATGLEVQVTVPCNTSTSTVRLSIDVADPGTAAPLEVPPQVSITVATNPTCERPVTLTSSATDGDNDLDSVRWRVDGVLLSPNVTEFTPTSTHLLEAVARDERGATTTATKEVACL